MILFEERLKDQYSDYSNVPAKISRMAKKGTIIRLKKGIYSDNPHESRFLIGNVLIRPSYVSFQSALSYHGLIPERVYWITSAAPALNKPKEFSNKFGWFSFQGVPKAVFPYGIITLDDGSQIASKEKAICDILYLLKPVRSIKDIRALLIEDLRIDEESLMSLEPANMRQLLPLYRCTNAKLALKFLEALWKTN